MTAKQNNFINQAAEECKARCFFNETDSSVLKKLEKGLAYFQELETKRTSMKNRLWQKFLVPKIRQACKAAKARKCGKSDVCRNMRTKLEESFPSCKIRDLKQSHRQYTKALLGCSKRVCDDIDALIEMIELTSSPAASRETLIRTITSVDKFGYPIYFRQSISG